MRKTIILAVIFVLFLLGCQTSKPTTYEEIPFNYEGVLPKHQAPEDAIAYMQKLNGSNETIITVILGLDNNSVAKQANLGFVPAYVLLKDVVEDNSLRIKECVITVVDKGMVISNNQTVKPVKTISLLVLTPKGSEVIELKDEEKRKIITKDGLLYIAYQSRETDNILIKNLG